MTREGLAKISDASALPVRGNEIAVHQTLSFQPHEAGDEAGDLVMVMLKNYPDGRERLSGIDTCRVCAVNRGRGNLTAASSSDAWSHHRTDGSSWYCSSCCLSHSSSDICLDVKPWRQDKRGKRRQDWRCFR
jgi:hypothetical protein